MGPRVMFVLGVGCFMAAFFCVRGAIALWPAALDWPMGFLAALVGFYLWTLGAPPRKERGTPLPGPRRFGGLVVAVCLLLATLGGLFLGPIPMVARWVASPGSLGSPTPGGQSANPMAPIQKAVGDAPQISAGSGSEAPASALSATPSEAFKPMDAQTPLTPLDGSLAAETGIESGKGNGPTPTPPPLSERVQDWLRRYRAWVVALCVMGALALSYVVWRRWKQRPRVAGTSGAADGAPLAPEWPEYVKQLRSLSAEFGVPAAPGLTVKEIQDQWQAAGYPSAELDPLTTYHYNTTCEDQPREPAAETSLRRLLKRLKQSPRKMQRL